MGDAPAATAILDRFLCHAEVITITDRSDWLKNQAAKASGREEACKKNKKWGIRSQPSLAYFEVTGDTLCDLLRSPASWDAPQ